MVRPARFELATYGFVGRTSEFSNLLVLKQHTVINRKMNFTFWLIFHDFVDFGKFFSHKSHTEKAGSGRNQIKLPKIPKLNDL